MEDADELEAARQLLTAGRQGARLARRVGTTFNQLRHWHRSAHAHVEGNPFGHEGAPPGVDRVWMLGWGVQVWMGLCVRAGVTGLRAYSTIVAFHPGDNCSRHAERELDQVRKCVCM